MAQTSAGFNGTVNDLQFAQMAPALGMGLLKPGDLAVSQVAGQRAVSVAPGTIVGPGVSTTLGAAEQQTLPTPTNGQWFLLVLHRVWATKATTLELRNSNTTATAASGPVPTSYPASLNTSPGVNHDQPVAWLWGNSTNTAVTIVPIARPVASLNPRRGSAAARDALYGAPAVGTPAAWYLQGAEWFNTDTGAAEYFAAAVDATNNPNGQGSVNAWHRVVPVRVSQSIAPAAKNTPATVGTIQWVLFGAIQVPVGATRAIVTYYLTNLTAPSSANNTNVQMQFAGGVQGQSLRLSGSGSGVSFNTSYVDDLDISSLAPGTTITPQINATFNAGSGSYGVTSDTRASLTVEFR